MKRTVSMQYRKLGKSALLVSALAYGCMRMPTKENNFNSANINEDEAIRIIRHAIDKGVNYVDTAYNYHNGASEGILGKALKDGYRDRVMLATKSPMIMIHSAEEYDKILNEQLKKLDTDCIDFYLFHALGKASWERAKRLDLISRAESAQKAGKIKYIAFSFHDTYNVFEEILNGYDKWALCQIQYNLMNENHQAGRKGLELAASKGIAVAIMEPLLGGKLALPIREVSDLMQARGYNGTLADLALRWIWNQRGVSTVLSGMSSVNQLLENLESAEKGLPETLSESELKLVEEIKAIYEKRSHIPCTGCGYCVPCPQGIKIPRVIDQYNDGLIYNYFEESKRMIGLLGKEVKNCTSCGECEKKCPQHISICEWIDKINRLMNA